MSEIRRKIVDVDWRPDGCTLLLDCGHKAEVNQIYTHNVGDYQRCYPCNHNGCNVFGEKVQEWSVTTS